MLLVALHMLMAPDWVSAGLRTSDAAAVRADAGSDGAVADTGGIGMVQVGSGIVSSGLESGRCVAKAGCQWRKVGGAGAESRTCRGSDPV